MQAWIHCNPRTFCDICFVLGTCHLITGSSVTLVANRDKESRKISFEVLLKRD